MLIDVIAFIFVLGVLVFVHELGHFLAAKAVGIGVPRFSIGFGPPTPLRFQRGETEYVVSWLPLGGYVKMASREEQEMMASLEGGALEQEYPPDKLFENKPLWARILTISAGVIMNVLFAWFVYAALAFSYGRTQDPTTTLSRVERDSLPEAALALAEVPRGTRILEVNDKPVATWDAIIDGVLEPRSSEVRFDFAGGVESVVVPIPGTEAVARADVAQAMLPLWEPRIGALSVGQPAEKAGFEPGDLIVAVDGVPIEAWDDLVAAIEPNVGTALAVSIERDGERLELTVTPVEHTLENPITGDVSKVGRIGIGPQLDYIRVKFGPVGAIEEGARRTWSTATTVIFAVKGLFTGAIPPSELGGPIMIGRASGQFARQGLVVLFLFMAFLSINLAIINLLPIPVLDGGHLVFLIFEGLRGKPLEVNARMRLTQVGLVIVLLLMVLAIGNDILREFGVY